MNRHLHIRELLLLSILLSQPGCKNTGENYLDSSKNNNSQIVIDNKFATVTWLEVPAGFKQHKVDSTRANTWHPTSLSILNGKFSVSVGPTSYVNSTKSANMECDHYAIGITKPVTDGEWGIVEVRMSMNYISTNILNKDASDIVLYDENSGVITFDLGQSVFKCRFVPK